jgi:hypothetical protein
MERSALADSIQVSLSGEIEGDLRKQAERELDELVRTAFAVSGGPRQLTVLLRELRRAIADARWPEISSEAERFLEGLTEMPRDTQERLFLVSRGVLRDFSRRNAVIDQTIGAGNVAEILKLSRQAVNDRWNARKLLGFKVNDTLRFPVWQFDPRCEDGVLPGLPQVLAALVNAGLTPLDQIYWLTSPKPEFDGRTPVDLLGERRTKPVLSQARGAGAH